MILIKISKKKKKDDIPVWTEMFFDLSFNVALKIPIQKNNVVQKGRD